MGKDKSEKSSKKEKKEKRSESDGVKKSSKKDKKSKLTENNVEAAFDEAVKANGGSTVESKEVVIVKDGNVEVAVVARPVAALVPFARPLADEKVGKKVLKGIKKASKNKTLKRGVKEVVKALRKRPAGLPADAVPSIVILAADISPMDVISHIPVLCEDHNIPYIFVVSRAELGQAGNTKRPTSVVMISADRSGSKKNEKIEGEEDWAETYKDLVKLVQKESRSVKI